MQKFAFLLLIIAFVATHHAFAADWPQWRGPNRDGIAPETFAWPAGEPKELWRVSVGAGYSGVSVCDGRVYTMGNDGENIGIGETWRNRDPGNDAAENDTVWCLYEKTGSVIWKYR